MCNHHESNLDGGHRKLEALDHDDPSDLTSTFAGSGAIAVAQAAMSRRTAIGAAVGGGVALMFAGVAASPTGGLIDALGPDLADAAATSCVLTPAKTVGPYFVDEKLDRSDVRADTSTGALQAGMPLTLRLYIFDADSDCAPVQGATVDIWHANGLGLYSDESANNTVGQNWLRGYQTTDADGLVTFKTVWPGWYSGRAVHVHFKVRIYNGTTETLEFTSQMFFPDAMNQQVFAGTAPYNSRSSTPDTLNGADTILGSDSATLVLNPTSDGAGGYAADFSVGVSQTTSQLGNNSTGGNGGPGGTPPTGAPPGGAPPTATTPTTTTTTTDAGVTTTTTTNSTTGESTSQTSTADTSLLATLKTATMTRTTLGTRQLKLTIKTQEKVTLTAALTRSGKTIVSKKGTLNIGAKTVKLTIPTATTAGAAKLAVTLVDGAGNKKSYARNLHVARKR